MKLPTGISIAVLGLWLAGIVPAFAEPVRHFDVSSRNPGSLMLASRSPDRQLRDDDREPAEWRGNGDARRQQRETQRSEPTGRFGYGFERRQERGERPTDHRNSRD